jgi:hypothetical protein
MRFLQSFVPECMSFYRLGLRRRLDDGGQQNARASPGFLLTCRVAAVTLAQAILAMFVVVICIFDSSRVDGQDGWIDLGWVSPIPSVKE